MKYDYVVKPKVPVRGLPAEKTFNKPSNVSFEKEDVLTYLRFGNVYRKFSIDDLVKVQRDNIDKLHVSAEEYYGLVAPVIEKLDPANDTTLVSNENTPVADIKPNIVKFGEPIANNTTEEKTEPVKEEVVEEATSEDAVLLTANEEYELEEQAEKLEEAEGEAPTLPAVNSIKETTENEVFEAETAEEPVLSDPVEASEEESEDISEENSSESTEETEKTEKRPQNGNNNYAQYHKKKKH